MHYTIPWNATVCIVIIIVNIDLHYEVLKKDTVNDEGPETKLNCRVATLIFGYFKDFRFQNHRILGKISRFDLRDFMDP